MGLFTKWKPDATAVSPWDIDYRQLQGQGKKALFFDLDNTLLPYNQTRVTEALRRLMQSLLDQGFKVLIVSNNHPPRIEPVARALSVGYVAEAGKPRARGFREAVRRTGLEPGACVAIGDQLLTDVIGARGADVGVILVNPISEAEFLGTRINRVFERILLWLLRIKRPIGRNQGLTEKGARA